MKRHSCILLLLTLLSPPTLPQVMAQSLDQTLIQTPPVGVTAGRIDLAQIPADHFTQAVLWSIALKPIPNEFKGGEFPDSILARLALNYEVREANEAVLRPTTIPYGANGTDAKVLGCERIGDYDFALRSWMIVLYKFWNRPDLLWPETRTKMLTVLAPERGNQIETSRKFCGIPIPETENHILMTEGSQYLTNQLINRERRERGLAPLAAYDNSKNGMTHWLLQHLQKFTKHDYDEYNSRPYQTYTFMAIQNLFEFSEDAQVATQAQNLLDIISAKVALSSVNLRRLPPFRRNQDNRSNWNLSKSDGGIIRTFALTGHFDFMLGLDEPMVWNFGVSYALPIVLGKYRLPELISQLVVNPPTESSFHRFSHGGVEIYDRHPEFLISGGGTYTKMRAWIPFPMIDDGSAVPTTLIPSLGVESNAQQLIRIEGHKNYRRQNNTCVAPGFACGLNVRIPETIPAHRQVKRSLKNGTFTFVDYSDFWVAVYQKNCESLGCKNSADNFGLFEARSSSEISFDDFIQTTLKRNKDFDPRTRGAQSYTLSTGVRIRFRFYENNLHHWPILSIANRLMTRSFSEWPLYSGPHLKAKGDGLVTLSNPVTRRKLIWDARDPLHPKRTERTVE